MEVPTLDIAEKARGIASRSPTVSRLAVKTYGRLRGFDVRTRDGSLAVTDRERPRCVVLNARHVVYARDVIDDFDAYFGAVEPTRLDPLPTVDYSEPREHIVRGWTLMPIEFPSLAEPLETARQYLEFAELTAGQTVIDLGAYSGFTSLLFKEAVGDSGRVLAVEADTVNLASLHRNLENYRKLTGSAPLVAETAVWSHNRGIQFLSEGNLGSAAASLMQRGGTEVRHVPSATLSDLAESFELGEVAFLKADIEGAELEAFSDKEFFGGRHPRIIFEGAPSKARGPQAVIDVLSEFGYRARIREQRGSRMPLVECV